MEQYTSPADSRAIGEQRCGWRLRLARSRREAHRPVIIVGDQTCPNCMRRMHIMPDGRMFPHSLRDTVPSAQRALYKEEHADKDNVWQCPGSYVYFGP